MKIFLLALLLPVFIYAQNDPVIHDTINVVTLQRFSVPQDKYIVLTNIKRIDFRAELFDSSFNKIREIPLDDLLVYNGMDTLIEYQLAAKQLLEQSNNKANKDIPF